MCMSAFARLLTSSTQAYRVFFTLQDPLRLDIVISFPDHGFHLRFDPWSQVQLSLSWNVTQFSAYLHLIILLFGLAADKRVC